MQTCCGCHCGDTNTAFFHVAPRAPGSEAALSSFLRTDRSAWQAVDPATRENVPSSEMALRVKLFKSLLHPDLDDITIMELQESRRARAH